MSVTSNDLGRHTRTLPAWQVVILLLLIVGFIVNSIMLDNINSNRIEHTRATDDIQIKAQQLAQHAVLAASGDQASFDDLKIKRDSIATKINSLNDGDKDNRYPRVPVAANDSLNTLNNSWFTIQSNVDKILDKQVLIQDMNAIYNKFASEIPQ